MLKSLMLGVAVAALSVGSLQAAELKFKPGDDAKFNWASYEAYKKAVDLSGETLTISGPWLGGDKDLFMSVIAYFEAATGAKVEYAGSDSFEQQIVIDTGAGSPPNIASFRSPVSPPIWQARAILFRWETRPATG
jgi:alpha-glucoside transport system substrate-binding protein